MLRDALPWVWSDGQLVKTDSVAAARLSAALRRSRGIFETMRSFHSRIFGLAEHIARLRRSCPVVGLRPPSQASLTGAVEAVAGGNGPADVYLRLNAFGSRRKTHILVFAKKLSLPSPTAYARGYSVILFDNPRLKRSDITRIKSLNRIFYERLFRRARRRGFDEALFLNEAGEVMEGTRTNVFLVKGHKVVTPSLGSGCLPGVTRAIVLKLLKKEGVTVRERRVMPDEFLEQEEIFLTNSLIGIMPVRRFDKCRIGIDSPGRLTQKIAALYKNAVEKSCFLR